jgi:hypothetical protein
MIRISIRLDERDYESAKKEARARGISFAELVRRSIRRNLSLGGTAPWMRYAGCIDSGNPASSQTVDETVYGIKR